MKNIQAVKIGNVVNISIGGKLHKKNCGSNDEAKELYRLALVARENPSDENIKAIRMYLNEKTRVAFLCGLETDLETGEAFLEGFNTPIPSTLLEVIKEYHENQYPMDAIINFWKLLMVNPDKRVRESLFQFITTHDFVLTDKGYMVVYKAVFRRENDKPADQQVFEEFVANKYLFVKKEWKCSPNKYVVYRDIESNKFDITKLVTAENWDEKERGVEVLGKLGDLYEAIIKSDNSEAGDEQAMYTDMHTQKMAIQLGQPIKMERHECDSDPAVDCSYGLHVGATKYVERFANSDSVILVCLVNPANVVAVPTYDHSKMRVTEYFPYAIATYNDGRIDIVEEQYFEEDYCSYEIEELEAAIAKVKAEELPYQAAQGAIEEERPMSELLKMLETRLVDIEFE